MYVRIRIHTTNVRILSTKNEHLKQNVFGEINESSIVDHQ